MRPVCSNPASQRPATEGSDLEKGHGLARSHTEQNAPDPLIDVNSVGRAFPALPNHMRVTIGKRNEMEAFLGAFRQTVSA